MRHGYIHFSGQSQFQNQILPEQLHVRIFISCKAYKICLVCSCTGSNISPAQRHCIHSCREKGMLMNQTGEKVCMRTRDTFTLYSYLCEEEQLALRSYIWYCLNCPWICTSASKILMFTSCSYIFWVSLNNRCESGFTVYGRATHPHSEIVVVSNLKK